VNMKDTHITLHYHGRRSIDGKRETGGFAPLNRRTTNLIHFTKETEEENWIEDADAYMPDRMMALAWHFHQA